MRLFYSILLIGIVTSAQAQWSFFDINPTSSNARVLQSDTIYTLDLPFWDDFSYVTQSPDTMLWAMGKDIFVNSTLAKNAPSYQVATFDGLKGTGGAHNIEANFNGPADSLISHYIDLSKVANNQRDSIYLSFFWQAYGFGEMPDEIDSLIVKCYAADSTWVTVWAHAGGEASISENFKQEIIKINPDQFLHSKFRIKFLTLSSTKGPFDTWHVDYIYLNDHRNAADTSHFDLCLTGTPTAPFTPYYAITSEHFFQEPQKYLSNQAIYAVNLNQYTTVQPVNEFFYELKNIDSDETYLSKGIGNKGENIHLYPKTDTISVENLDGLSITTPIDSIILEATFYANTGDKNLFEQITATDTLFLPVDLKVNDTIRTRYHIENYYAYDDGTAEFAAAINILDGMVAMRYVLPKADTLTHVDIYFPNIAPASAGKALNIIVWKKLDKKGILTLQPITIKASEQLNEFTRIQLSQAIFTPDTFYIGYQQKTNNYIGIGFDRNNTAAGDQIYFNINSQWEQNTRLQGALMIRPVFGADSTLVLSNHPTLQTLVYPNPTSGIIHLNNPTNSIQVFTLSGALIYQGKNQNDYNLDSLKNGLYLLKGTSGTHHFSQKLVIQH